MLDGRSAVNQISTTIQNFFVPVAVNQHNGIKSDGENGRFIERLGKRQANFFQVATPDGELVAALHLSGVNVDNAKEIGTAWGKWRQRPEESRRPGAIKLPEKPPDPPAVVNPPTNGLVLRVYTRHLNRDVHGDFQRLTQKDVNDRTAFPDDSWRWAGAIYTQPMPDVMWLTQAEWKSIIPAVPVLGQRYPISDAIRMRLFRYHLIDGTQELTPGWKLADVRSGAMTVTVENVDPELRLRVDGSALMATNANLAQARHGYDVRLAGTIHYDAQRKLITRFDLVAVGDCWGSDWETGRLARPGRAPLGIALELVNQPSAAVQVTPKGVNFARLADSYFAAEKP